MIELLDPTTEAAAQSVAYAARPDTLVGKRVALVENTKFNSDTLLLKIGELLKQEYGVAEAKLYHKRNASVPAHEEIIADITQSCDLVVAGIGD
jgi:hypothetical protein